jgi:RNA polymerase sigma factor (sigma-70 family)
MSAALETIVARFARLLRHVALRHGLPPEDVAEVVQEVRVRLWRARPTRETIETLGVSYIYRTAMSAALEVVRRKRGSGPVVSMSDDWVERSEGGEPVGAGASAVTVSTERGPEQALVRSEVALAVSQAVHELPQARRTAVRLYLVGYSRDEIARSVGWSEAKTRNLIYRGLADVRAALGRRGIGPGELA